VRICIIGKYPPIQGGVSTRSYWTAHALAARGHEVHVVTNAKEAGSPFRVYMRPQDWKACEASNGRGSVRVHWSDPVDRSQSYIPMASPFVSKLAGIAVHVALEHPFDVIYAHYLEPYGVAGHLAAEIIGVPHVVRLAGSDAGRLWHHPQLQPVYDHVLRSAKAVIAAGEVARRAIERGVAVERVVWGGAFAVPDDVFAPQGPLLDVADLRRAVESEPEFRNCVWGDFAGQSPYFGVYGKLGETKGSFALLAAMQRLKAQGLEVGLVALAHGTTPVQRRFRAAVRKLGLTDRMLQLPFLPNWRVPEFLRSSLAVCCLEQDFPIGLHSPIVALETLLSGACLVASTEVIRKLPAYGRLVHRYGCIAIDDVTDIEMLASELAAIARDPRPAAALGTRGRRFACELQRGAQFPNKLEAILAAAASRQNPPRETPTVDRRVVATTNEHQSAEVETRIAHAEGEAAASGAREVDPLFRLQMRRWGLGDDDLVDLIVERDPRSRLLEFGFDVSRLIGVGSVENLPQLSESGTKHIVAFSRGGSYPRAPRLVDALTARILQLSDGTRSVFEIVHDLGGAGATAVAEHLGWIERLFVEGLISLRERDDIALDRAPTGAHLEALRRAQSAK
jgi:glycosyltransferase involved in cell wall biosynthesis